MQCNVKQLCPCIHLLSVQELGDRCMHADKDQRFSFQELLPQLKRLHQQLVFQNPEAQQDQSDGAVLNGRPVVEAVQQSKSHG